MPHPTEEELVAYLYGEVDETSQARLSMHIASCAECRTKVGTWRGVMSELDEWSLPQKRFAAAWLGRARRWVAAAVLLIALGCGVGLGAARLLEVRSRDVKKLRAQIERTVESAVEARLHRELQEKLAADLQTALADTRDDLRQEIYSELRKNIGQLSANTVAASGMITKSLLSDFVRTYYAAREEEDRALLRLLTQIESRRMGDQEILRGEFAQLASFTGVLARLVASGKAYPPASNTPDPGKNPQEERRQE